MKCDKCNGWGWGTELDTPGFDPEGKPIIIKRKVVCPKCGGVGETE